jgi:hypothetical protein
MPTPDMADTRQGRAQASVYRAKNERQGHRGRRRRKSAWQRGQTRARAWRDTPDQQPSSSHLPAWGQEGGSKRRLVRETRWWRRQGVALRCAPLGSEPCTSACSFCTRSSATSRRRLGSPHQHQKPAMTCFFGAARQRAADAIAVVAAVQQAIGVVSDGRYHRDGRQHVDMRARRDQQSQSFQSRSNGGSCRPAPVYAAELTLQLPWLRTAWTIQGNVHL